MNIVALMSANQEREEKIRSYAARLRGLAGICILSLTCSKEDCDESVSYANAMILHAMVKGLFDDDTKEEVLSKTPELDLESTITFVEAREAGKRSAGVLVGGGLASSQVNKLTAHQAGKKTDMLRQTDDDDKKCNFCNKYGHDAIPNSEVRASSCPAFGQVCKKCGKSGHFKQVCRNKAKTQTLASVVQSITGNMAVPV